MVLLRDLFWSWFIINRNVSEKKRIIWWTSTNTLNEWEVVCVRQPWFRMLSHDDFDTLQECYSLTLKVRICWRRKEQSDLHLRATRWVRPVRFQKPIRMWSDNVRCIQLNEQEPMYEVIAVCLRYLLNIAFALRIYKWDTFFDVLWCFLKSWCLSNCETFKATTSVNKSRKLSYCSLLRRWMTDCKSRRSSCNDSNEWTVCENVLNSLSHRFACTRCSSVYRIICPIRAAISIKLVWLIRCPENNKAINEIYVWSFVYAFFLWDHIPRSDNTESLSFNSDMISLCSWMKETARCADVSISATG